ncbi:TadE/TadG family type IV pilus assembly protein [Hyalangium versicolor]|uniref:TadE/TadG family type IV pilus assembly protein n=1 Tax=Hyalangium versicolor TaxID=2861190 RepID=UPI001CCCEE5B|nr:TadE/TadG family type IV pilus assembly protein [Hyalangium versicolor]
MSLESLIRRLNTGESGQAAVESAIILPLFVFLLLGILQLGLMHQARLMTKYAAYKAVRAGAIHNAKKDAMEYAALAVMLPLVSEGRSGSEYIQPINNASDFRTKWNQPGVLGNRMADTGLPYVEIVTCGPTTAEANSGSAQEMDFDDPQVAAAADWRGNNRTKLRIQVTFNYRMPIPFANWVIFQAALNKEIPMLMRMGKPKGAASAFFAKYESAASRGAYVLPIRAAYTMRMQSNIYVSQLPSSNSCLTTNKF